MAEPPPGAEAALVPGRGYTGVALLLVALGASNAPTVPAAPPRPVDEPPRGPAPGPVRWHRIRLTHRRPDRVAVHAPERCPGCGQAEVDWIVPVASHERHAGLAGVLGLGFGAVGALAARAL
ncbi:MAG: hypothetical protein KF878_04530 [Planctomycetes bacterium]|nr:hypothetical protein [Planctomycetota bacterium]